MKQTVLLEKYPIFEMELPKTETDMQSVDAIIAHFKAKIDAHPIVAYIGTFDHYAHTKGLPDGEVAPNILDAKLIVFCFGTKLPNPHVMAVRPRSIGVADLGDTFVINFMEPPMPVATQAMEAWAQALRKI
ncbi:MAG: hypothetical protein FNT29_05610 [Halothiobacillaceae bacterium]|jgi:hypothetical protein|nr:MAG: hypothetical protein FNT29_05610 [Halothiobacillaceae bacterium]